MLGRALGRLVLSQAVGARLLRPVGRAAVQHFSTTGSGPKDRHDKSRYMGKRDEEREDEEEEEEEDDLRDPFGFLELKDRLQESEEEEGDDAVYVHPIEVERVEEEMERRGAAKLKKNVFGLEEIPKEMEAMWELGVPHPNLLRNTEETPGQLRGAAELYWPSHLSANLPEEDQIYPQLDEPIYTNQEIQHMEEREMGGVCEGKLQRRGDRPLRCRKLDLEELHFTNTPLMFKFLTSTGHIKPKRLSGLCSRCQRHVARTVKRARHMGMIPHTMGLDIYKRLDLPIQEAGEGEGADGPIVTSVRRSESVAERVKKLPSRTI